MKTTITSALAAIALVAGFSAGQAQAQGHPMLRFPHKSAPYAVPHTHPKGEYAVRRRSDCRRTVIIRSSHGQRRFFCPKEA